MSKYPDIVMYHSVAQAADRAHDPHRITVTPRRLDRQLDWLARRGLRGVAVRQLLAARDRRGLVGLTFDDGYADFLEHAVPTLLRHGFTASVYVVADRIGKANDWEDGGPIKPLMSESAVTECAAAGMEIGSHGMRHVHLRGADRRVVRHEIAESSEFLSDLLHLRVPGYCYAYGDLDAYAVEQVRTAGYEYACAVGRSAWAGQYALPRTYVGQADTAPRLWAKYGRAALRPGRWSPVPARHALRVRGQQ
jgi:peptidoglycan/xylan/chitin deacetylase (PgdA/CDA1 family)